MNPGEIKSLFTRIGETNFLWGGLLAKLEPQDSRVILRLNLTLRVFYYDFMTDVLVENGVVSFTYKDARYSFNVGIQMDTQEMAMIELQLTLLEIRDCKLLVEDEEWYVKIVMGNNGGVFLDGGERGGFALNFDRIENINFYEDHLQFECLQEVYTIFHETPTPFFWADFWGKVLGCRACEPYPGKIKKHYLTTGLNIAIFKDGQFYSDKTVECIHELDPSGFIGHLFSEKKFETIMKELLDEKLAEREEENKSEQEALQKEYQRLQSMKEKGLF